MTLIPYDEFQIKESTLNHLKEAYANRKISEYFKQHGELPDAEMTESFHNIPSDLMDGYKKYFYSRYYHNEYEFEKENGPRELIETSFDFSTTVDNDSTLFGTRSNILFGTSTSGNDDEYLYEYWTIAIEGGNMRKIGCFTSLSNASIKLYSLEKYRVFVYHRKSNYQYEEIFGGKAIDNTFSNYWWPESRLHDYDISSYYGPWSHYNTQNEDKEYIGFVGDYVPTIGGTIKGCIFTLNPIIALNVSGLTGNIVFDLKC